MRREVAREELLALLTSTVDESESKRGGVRRWEYLAIPWSKKSENAILSQKEYEE